MTMVAIESRKLRILVTWLDRVVRKLRELLQPALAIKGKRQDLSEREQMLAALKAEGLIRDLTPQERVHAERWRALPEEEKQATILEMYNLKPGPMLSDIVIQNRR